MNINTSSTTHTCMTSALTPLFESRARTNPAQPRSTSQAQAPYAMAPAGVPQQQGHFGMHTAPMVVQGPVQGVPHTGNTRCVTAADDDTPRRDG